MGDLLRAAWLVLATLVPAFAGYALSVRFFKDRGVFERLLVAMLSGISLIVVTFLVADLVRPITALSLNVVSTALSVGLVLALRQSVREVWDQVKVDLGAPRRLFADSIATREPAVLLLAPALVILAGCVWLVLFFRSWGWDVLMFHTTITDTIVQEGSLAFVDTNFHQVRGYPRNVHLLAAWATFFLKYTTLDDAPQLPFGLIGALVCAAFARRFGASRAFSTALGAAWLCFPPVMLELPSVHVDVACAALLGAGAYFNAFSIDRRDRWASAMAFGLYLGTKHTGLFHLALYSPILLVRGLLELRASQTRLKVLLDGLASVGLMLVLGAHKYVQNALVMGNPAWPFIITVPGLGPLPGENDASSQYGGPPGGRASFFGIPGELARFIDQLRHWDAQAYYPDVRDGYFGFAFTVVAIPCLFCALWAVKTAGRRWAPLALWFLVFAAVSVPSAYWPRYSMATSIAGVAAIGLVWTFFSRPLQLALSAVLVGCFGYSLWLTGNGLMKSPDYGWPALFWKAPGWTAEERATQHVVSWNWPQADLQLRERLFQPGDVVTFDHTVNFPGELFTADLRTRVVYVQSVTDLQTFAARTLAHQPRWSIVYAQGHADLLEQAGAKRIAPLHGGTYWLLEWPKPAKPVVPP